MKNFLGIIIMLLLAVLGYGYSLYLAMQRRVAYLERKQGHLQAQLKEAEERAVSAETELAETRSYMEMLANLGKSADPVTITKQAISRSKSNIEQLAEAGKSGNPIELSKQALDIGMREVGGVAKVVGKIFAPKADK